MNANLKLWLLAGLAALAAACTGGYSAANNLTPNAALGENSRTTVLVYSQVAARGGSRLFFRDYLNQKNGSYTATEWHPLLENQIEDRQFSGSLKVLAVKGGQTEFYRWQWQNATGVAEGRYWSALVDLKPGRVIYLGRVRIDGEGRKTDLKVVDAAQEDLALFRELYPGLAEEPVETQLLEPPGDEDPTPQDTPKVYLP